MLIRRSDALLLGALGKQSLDELFLGRLKTSPSSPGLIPQQIFDRLPVTSSRLFISSEKYFFRASLSLTKVVPCLHQQTSHLVLHPYDCWTTILR